MDLRSIQDTVHHQDSFSLWLALPWICERCCAARLLMFSGTCIYCFCYPCVYECKYAILYIYIYIYIQYASSYNHIHVYTYVCIRLYIYIYIHIFPHMGAYIYICFYISICIHIYIYTYRCTYMYTNMCNYINILNIYIYAYIYGVH